MITGDHLFTAKYVAQEIGIISAADAKNDKSGIVLTGDTFRQKIGPYKKVYDEGLKQMVIEFDDPE